MFKIVILVSPHSQLDFWLWDFFGFRIWIGCRQTGLGTRALTIIILQVVDSELVCAVDSVHKMCFIHRNIKPENIKLTTDFGLCTGFRRTHNSKYYHINGMFDNIKYSARAV